MPSLAVSLTSRGFVADADADADADRDVAAARLLRPQEGWCIVVLWLLLDGDGSIGCTKCWSCEAEVLAQPAALLGRCS